MLYCDALADCGLSIQEQFRIARRRTSEFAQFMQNCQKSQKGGNKSFEGHAFAILQRLTNYDAFLTTLIKVAAISVDVVARPHPGTHRPEQSTLSVAAG